MYHVELRQFPHNSCRFNLAGAELRPIVEPWVREMAVEFGERKWSPHTASLTILEGRELLPRELTMGRGWRTAQRESEDVTGRVLAAARAAVQAAAAGQGREALSETAARQPGTAAPLSDPLAVGVQIAALLGPDPTRLLDAWRAAASASPELAPSEALALAEQSIHASDAKR
jgi:hypothetical protein